MNDDLRRVDNIARMLVAVAAGQGAFFVILFLVPGSAFYVLAEGRPDTGTLLFWGGTFLLLLIAGLGLRSRRRWGYRAFKVILYLLMPGFPIGTYLAMRGLALLQAPGVRRQFGYPE